MDMFGFSSSGGISNKFNVGKYFSGGKRMSTSSIIDSNSEASKSDAELARVIKEIKAVAIAREKDLEKFNRELIKKRVAIDDEIKDMRGNTKGEVIAALHKTDLDIINTQIKLVESKYKISQDKFKSIRDEKNLVWGRNKTNAPAVGQISVSAASDSSPMNYSTIDSSQNQGIVKLNNPASPVNNSPTGRDIVNAEIIETAIQNKSGHGSGIPSDVVMPKTQGLSIPETEMSATAKSILNGERVSTGDGANPSPSEVNYTVATDAYSNPEIVKKTLAGVETSVSDVYMKNRELAKLRLEETEQNKLGDIKGRLGHSLSLSADAITTSKTPHKEVLYVDRSTGKFWMEAYELNPSTQQYDTPCKTWHPHSVIKIGRGLKFDPGTKIATVTNLTPQQVEYIVREDSNGMSDFYNHEWIDPKTESYLINEDDLIKL